MATKTTTVKKPTVKKAAAKKATTAKEPVEETKKLPKNPNEFSYRGDEDLIIKANEFLLLAEALEIAIQNGVETSYPTAYKYIASATGIDVPNPTKEEINTGAVRQMMDIEKTFSQGNVAQSYKPWLVPKVVDAKTKIFEIHARNVQDGRAVEYKVLQEEAKAKQKAAAEAAANQEGPKTKAAMEVVK